MTQALQHAKQEVDVQAAFVRFVDDERVVGRQVRVVAQFRQQDAVRHQLDERVLGGAVRKAHLKADRCAERLLQFLGNTRGHGTRRNSPRLRVPDQPAPSTARLQA